MPNYICHMVEFCLFDGLNRERDFSCIILPGN